MVAKAEPKPKFTTLGKSKFVHVIRTAAWDRKNAQCQTVRKYMVADKIDYKGKHLSAEGASALDPCPNCDTAAVIESVTPDEVKRERRKQQRDETLEKIKDSTKTKGQRDREARAKGKSASAGVKKALNTPKGKDKPVKTSKRSSGDSTKEKAEQLAAFASEHGWVASVVEVEGQPGVMVRAHRGQEVIECWFVDGKYDTTRHAKVIVGSWEGKLRGVHGCRKQMSLEGRDRPHPEPGKGRTGPRTTKVKGETPEDVIPEDESPEDARRRVPFLLDDEEAVIVDALLGKTIRWRNGVSNVVDEAVMPSKWHGKKRDLITIKDHPKTGRRLVEFLSVVGRDEEGRDVYGSERAVALDKIVRVVG